MLMCDPRAKAKCPFGDPCFEADAGAFEEGSDCDKFNQQVCALTPTRADHIRDMSDTDLAKNNVRSVVVQNEHRVDTLFITTDGYQSESKGQAIAHELAWLREPAEE